MQTSVRTPDMPVRQILAAAAKQLLAESARLIFTLHQAAPLKFRGDVFDEVSKSAGSRTVHHVDAIDSSGCPFLQPISNLCRRTSNSRSLTEQARNISDSCRPIIRHARNYRLQNASYAFNLYFTDGLIPRDITEIDSDPAAGVGQHPVGAKIFVNLKLFAASLFFRASDTNERPCKNRISCLWRP